MKVDLSKVDEKCRNCPNLVIPFNFINRKTKEPRKITCKLSISTNNISPDNRGYYGNANPERCNNGTILYHYDDIEERMYLIHQLSDLTLTMIKYELGNKLFYGATLRDKLDYTKDFIMDKLKVRIPYHINKIDFKVSYNKDELRISPLNEFTADIFKLMNN